MPLLTRALRIANDLLDKDPSGQNQTEPGSGTKAEERKIGFVVGPLREFTHPSLHLPTSSCVEISVDWSHQLSEPVLSCGSSRRSSTPLRTHTPTRHQGLLGPRIVLQESDGIQFRRVVRARGSDCRDQVSLSLSLVTQESCRREETQVIRRDC